jgi:hypothetical protein
MGQPMNGVVRAVAAGEYFIRLPQSWHLGPYDGTNHPIAEAVKTLTLIEMAAIAKIYYEASN